MRDLRNADVRHRVKGVPALTRRLIALLLAVKRFGEHRARSRQEQFWASATFEALAQALRVARSAAPEAPGHQSPDTKTADESRATSARGL